MVYLTLYLDGTGRVRSHAGPAPLDFLRDVPERGRVLYRVVIDGTIVEDDAP